MASVEMNELSEAELGEHSSGEPSRNAMNPRTEEDIDERQSDTDQAEPASQPSAEGHVPQQPRLVISNSSEFPPLSELNWLSMSLHSEGKSDGLTGTKVKVQIRNFTLLQAMLVTRFQLKLSAVHEALTGQHYGDGTHYFDDDGGNDLSDISRVRGQLVNNWTDEQWDKVEDMLGRYGNKPTATMDTHMFVRPEGLTITTENSIRRLERFQSCPREGWVHILPGLSHKRKRPRSDKDLFSDWSMGPHEFRRHKESPINRLCWDCITLLAIPWQPIVGFAAETFDSLRWRLDDHKKTSSARANGDTSSHPLRRNVDNLLLLLYPRFAAMASHLCIFHDWLNDLSLNHGLSFNLTRFLIALLSGTFLLAPIIWMSFVDSQERRLVISSVFVVIFSFILSYIKQVTMVDVLSGSAAYAAVLVVFVGSALSSTSGNQ